MVSDTEPSGKSALRTVLIGAGPSESVYHCLSRIPRITSFLTGRWLILEMRNLTRILAGIVISRSKPPLKVKQTPPPAPTGAFTISKAHCIWTFISQTSLPLSTDVVLIVNVSTVIYLSVMSFKMSVSKTNKLTNSTLMPYLCKKTTCILLGFY